MRKLDPSVQPEDLVFVDDKAKNVEAAIVEGWQAVVHDARTCTSENALADALVAIGLPLAPEEG